MIFDKLKVYLVRLGSLKGKVRREILEKRILENGALPVPDVSQADIAVSCAEVPAEQTERALGSFRGRVVDAKWITESITHGKQLDPLAFEIDVDRRQDIPSSPKKLREEPDVSCSSPSSGENLNLKIADVFDRLATLVQASVDKKDQFRSAAYRKAARVLRKADPIQTEEDAESLKSQLGPRTVDKVKEYLSTGYVKKEEFLAEDSSVQAKQRLMGVWGIGPSKAAELVSQGIDSIEKLRADSSALTSNQKTGLEYYEELLEKMPRREVEEIRDVVEKTKSKLFGDDLEMVLCGSYRRGAATCSDVDLLLAWKNGAHHILSPEETVSRIVERLSSEKFLVDHFNKKDHHSIFLGICRLGPGRSARRIDIKVWPRSSFLTALVHFTGSADFNRRLRLHAKRKGYKLSDIGLRDPTGNLIRVSSEQQLFDVLGAEWIPPESRLSGADLILTDPLPVTERETTDIDSSEDQI